MLAQSIKKIICLIVKDGSLVRGWRFGRVAGERFYALNNHLRCRFIPQAKCGHCFANRSQLLLQGRKPLLQHIDLLRKFAFPMGQILVDLFGGRRDVRLSRLSNR